MAKDLDKYYALVEKCINMSKIAWRDLAKKRKELSPASLYFIDMLSKVKDEFKNNKS
ncbi:MAG: hypothetical protein U9P61_02230 [Patescibacteria group bacterium]|nr:hypothetical protein [Patescibacteria group bacterium]